MLAYKIEEKINMIPLITKAMIINSKNKNFETIKYGDSIKQYYRFFMGEGNKATIVFIHGGGWWHGSPKTSSYIGSFFNKLGYNVVMIGYRLVPLYKYPTQINDVFEALKTFINKESNIKDIVVIGFSAGGELACNLVFNKDKQLEYSINKDLIKGLITFAGVLDFNKCTTRRARTLIECYIGDNKDYWNPIDLVNSEVNSKVMCVHGTKDQLIDIDNSITFVDKVNEYGDNAKLVTIKGRHHSDIMSLFINKGEKESKIVLDFIEMVCKR